MTFGAVASLACVLVASRALLAPKYLFYFDSVNFALALEDFNPALHQPQPPGYPFFVLFTRLLWLLAPSPQWTFVAAGILGSLAAVVLVWMLGRDLFGFQAGNRAALLLLFNPPFWFGALTNQVRIFLAVGSAALMIAVWRSMQEEHPRWFYISGAVLGIASGFRPELVAFGAPLVIYAGWRKRRRLREWLVATGVLAVTIAFWLTFVVVESGGAMAYVQLLKEYSDTQFSSTSMAFGAQPIAAKRMFLMALIWYGLPVLTWLWLTPFARGAASKLSDRLGFLTVAVAPAFVFHALVHVGDPDHTLFGVPALAVAGGLVLASIKRMEATVLAVCLNVFLFFAPPRGIAAACSYAAVRHIDSVTQATFSGIQMLRDSGSVVLVTYDHPLTWRHFAYYLRDTPLVVLQNDPRLEAKQASAWLINAAMDQSGQTLTSEIVLPAADKIVWLLSDGRGMHRLLQQNVELSRIGSLVYTDIKPGSQFMLGPYVFRTPVYDRVGR